MKVNFLFDEFKFDNEPWWNVCEVSVNRLSVDELYPQMFWLTFPIRESLTYNNIGIEPKNEINFVYTIEHELKEEELNIYPVFISDKYFESPNAVLWIPTFVVDKVNKGLVYLMITNYFETDFIEPLIFMRNLTRFLNVIGLTNYDNVKIVGNDFINEKFINERFPIKYITSHTFERFYSERLVRLNPHINIDSYIDKKNKKYDFLMQVGSPRNFRYFMFKILEYGGTLKNALYSYMPHQRGEHTLGIKTDTLDRYTRDYFFREEKSIIEQLNEEKFNDFLSWIKVNDKIESTSLPNRKMNHDDVYNTSPYTPSEWIEDTYFSVVMETQVSNFNSFITEKVFKLFFLGHPFILYGSPGSLRELHKLGYQTFPELFDESYDDMPNSFDKMFFIMNQIKKWTLPENKNELEGKIKLIKPKLLQNKSLYLSKDHSLFWDKFLNKRSLI